MKVYLLVEMIDLGYLIVDVYKDQSQAIEERDRLNTKFSIDIPGAVRSNPFEVEEFEVL